MKNIIGFIFGSAIIFWTIYTPFYWLFFDSAEDKVEKVALSDVMLQHTRTVMDSAKDIKNNKKEMESFCDELEKSTGIDITKPIYKILKKRNDIKNLEIYKVNEQSFKDATLSSYILSFENGKNKIQILFLMKEPSFFNLSTGDFIDVQSVIVDDRQVDVMNTLEKIYKNKI